MIPLIRAAYVLTTAGALALWIFGAARGYHDSMGLSEVRVSAYEACCYLTARDHYAFADYALRYSRIVSLDPNTGAPNSLRSFLPTIAYGATTSNAKVRAWGEVILPLPFALLTPIAMFFLSSGGRSKRPRFARSIAHASALTAAILLSCVAIMTRQNAPDPALYADVRFWVPAVTVFAIVTCALTAVVHRSISGRNRRSALLIIWLATLGCVGAATVIEPFTEVGAGVVGVLIGAALCRWFLAAQDDGEAPHCRKCGYSLRGNISGVCPECGLAAN